MWKDLNMNDKSRWMRFFMDNGVYDLGQMKEQYNSFQTGGFMDRLKSAMSKSSHPQVVYWDKVGKTDFNEPQIEFGGSGGFGGAGSYGEWGDVDYVRNTPIPPVFETFNDAFARARKAGQATFWFDGKLYNTEIDPNYKSNPRAENRTQILTLPMNQREVFTNKGVQLQDSTIVEPYYGQMPGWIERETIDDKVKETYIGPEPKWPNEYKSGGSIHIKHPGRLTALKKRTGKTEAELWATGNKDYRRMITFARNSRKWKHQDGGYLDDIIWDNMGQWSHPGQITGITGTKDGTDITMNGVADYLIGKDNLGNIKFMKPGMDYHFPGSSVVEYPLKYQFGGLFKKKETPNYIYTTYGLNSQGDATFAGSYNNPIFGYQPLSGINQSIGRDYSMPDYGAVAYTSYPIYMNEEPAGQVVSTFDPVTLRNRQMYAESAGNPRAKSHAGAQGLFQIMPDTLKWYQEQTKDYGDVYDPIYNERVRNWYMDWINARPLLQREDINEIEKQRIAIASYNRGYNAVKNIYNKYGDDWLNHLPKETRDYVNFIVDKVDSGGGRTNKAYDDWYNKGNKYIKQYGGLIKPFSYTDIPVVRYGFGGYSYI